VREQLHILLGSASWHFQKHERFEKSFAPRAAFHMYDVDTSAEIEVFGGSFCRRGLIRALEPRL
jgi:hypothetical protein